MIILKTTIKKARIILVLATLFPVLMLQSCDYSYLDGLEDIQDYTYSPIFAIPLVNSSISIDDLFDMEDLAEIEVDPEGLINLVYRGNVFTINANNIFTLKDQNQNFTFNNIVPSASGSVDLPPQSFVYLITFDKNEVINWISFLNGSFHVTAQSDLLVQDGYSMNGSFKILNSFDRNGNPIGGTISLDEAAIIDLSGSRIEFLNDANFFLVEYTLTISGNGTPNNAPYSIDFFQTASNIQYDLVKGYFDQIDFTVGSTNIPVSIFSNTEEGSIVFEKPAFDFTIESSFGLPVDLNVIDFVATVSGNKQIAITGPAVDNPWRLGYPVNPADLPVITSMEVNPSNTNLFSITEQSPKEIYYNVRGLTNPDSTLETTNWLKHDSSLSIDIEMKLPFYGRIHYFNVQDTIPVTIDSIPSEIDWIELKMNLTNGLPLGAKLNILMLDKNNQLIDTLFKKDNLYMQPAPIDRSTGLTTGSFVSQLINMLDPVTLENFRNTTNLVIDASFETAESQDAISVKVLESYRLGIELGMRVKAKVVVEFGQ